MRTIALLAALLALVLLGPSLVAAGSAIGSATKEIVLGPEVDISMMPQPAALFEKACGRAGSSVELAAWIETSDCPKD